MPNADTRNLQAELDLLREQVQSQFAARLLEWERREAELGEIVAARTVEFQAAQARAELDRYRLELAIADLEKRLAFSGEENAKLHSVLEALMAEHAACAGKAAELQNAAQLQHLKAQLERAESECVRLHQTIETSVALRLARSIPWLLRPLRALFAKPSHSSGAGS